MWGKGIREPFFTFSNPNIKYIPFQGQIQPKLDGIEQPEVRFKPA